MEWQDSPIGPYQEVAVLSGLVARGLSIGAWASHIVVTTDDAVLAGRSVFGLPARQGSIDFGGSIFDVVPSSPSPRAEAAEAVWGAAAALAVFLKTAVGAAVPGVAEPAERLRRPPRARLFEGVEFRADNEVGVCGWDGWLDERDDGSEVEGWSVSLPSFSGLLPTPAASHKHPTMCLKSSCTLTFPMSQQMANLPKERLFRTPPFYHSSIDIFGLFEVRHGKTTRANTGTRKIWVLL